MPEVTLGKLKLSIWEERLCADELLFELRAGDWQTLPPKLLIEPPTFKTPGGKGMDGPCYLTAICPHNAHLDTRALEVAIMQSDYQQALYEIDGLGYLAEWQSFMSTRMRLFWVENRKVRQNPRTSGAVRRSMGLVFKRAVVRPSDMGVRLLE
jgi:hypothetical protein